MELNRALLMTYAAAYMVSNHAATLNNSNATGTGTGGKDAKFLPQL